LDLQKTLSVRAIAHQSSRRASIVIGGVWGPGFGGNSTSSLVLQQAFEAAGFEVYGFGFRRDWKPGRPLASKAGKHLELHTRPFACHSEGVFHRRVLKEWLCTLQPAGIWILNSRHVSALPPGFPYILWEATTWRDEIDAGTEGLKLQHQRPGLGRMLHTLMRPLDRYSERRALRGASIVAAMSNHTAKCIVEENLAAAEKVRVLPHPPSSSFEKLVGSLATYPEAERDFISVARWIDPRKGAILLEHAVTHLAARGKKYSWTLVGDGADRAAASLRLAGVKVDVGLATDDHALIDLIRRHRYLVIPAFQEGFGITGIEAFHCMVPVVTTKCGGPEDYVEDGRTGFIGSVDGYGLADALSRAAGLAEDNRKAMAQAARREATTRFSHRTFVDDVLRLSRSVFETA
jgi:glycosyltransferase involved in cell wall biosynthesis